MSTTVERAAHYGGSTKTLVRSWRGSQHSVDVSSSSPPPPLCRPTRSTLSMISTSSFSSPSFSSPSFSSPSFSSLSSFSPVGSIRRPSSPLFSPLPLLLLTALLFILLIRTDNTTKDVCKVALATSFTPSSSSHHPFLTLSTPPFSANSSAPLKTNRKRLLTTGLPNRNANGESPFAHNSLSCSSVLSSTAHKDSVLARKPQDALRGPSHRPTATHPPGFVVAPTPHLFRSSKALPSSTNWGFGETAAPALCGDHKLSPSEGLSKTAAAVSSAALSSSASFLDRLSLLRSSRETGPLSATSPSSPFSSPSSFSSSTWCPSENRSSGQWASEEGLSDSAVPFAPLGSTPVLDRVRYPNDLKALSVADLKQLASELRWEIVRSVSETGGHFGSSLGVVELTTALHYVFDTPEDRIIWDVSHQAYPHKILTGRRTLMPTIRKKDGLSGFCKRAENPYDSFGAGHSSTSISAAQGMAVGRTLLGKDPNHCIAVIGDGGITAGMAYEAMNSCGYLHTPVLAILNDNAQVSLPTGMASAGGTAPAGALSSYTARLLTSRPFKNFRKVAKGISELFPESIKEAAAKLDEYGRGILTGGGTLFEELGFYYVGPVDGHDLENLILILKNIKNSDRNKPVLLHVKTEKGYGYFPAMEAADKMHGVVQFDIATGKQQKKQASLPAYTQIFAEELCRLGQQDPSVSAITAAMPGGTGVGIFGKRFPERTYDVGIAEQHAVTFSAGLACEGVKPFCCIYSTFLQRGYDQVVHDVVLQSLPVRFILDRAGLVGADGATHHGAFDLAYLGTLPNIVIMAPSDEVELKNMIQTAYSIDDKPSVVRFPRGTAYGLEFLNERLGYSLKELPSHGQTLEIGRGRLLRSARSGCRQKIAILSLGTRAVAAMEAADLLEAECADTGVTVADARFMRPLDIELIRDLAVNHDVLLTVEEGAVGGFGSHVLHFMTLDGLLDEGKVKVRSLVLPDKFIENAEQNEQYDEAALNAPQIAQAAKRVLKKKPVGSLLV